MNNFSYYTPTEICFGKDTVKEAGRLVRKYGGSKVLLHYGGGSVIRSGVLDTVKQSLTESSVAFVELGGVLPNPRLSLVYEGIALGQKENIDFILAVGGGSVIDSAKAIGCGLYHGGDVWDFYEGKRKVEGCVPLGTVLTISAAGSEMSSNSIISNEAIGVKKGCGDNAFRAKFSIMNPELTISLPWYQTACGCTDIIMHTEERYFTSKGNMELTDGIAEALMRTVMRNALILKDDPTNYEARAEVMWAGSLSHNGLTECGNGGNDFATHRMEHELSALFDVTHGAGLAALWGSWARYVLPDCLPRFKKFAQNVVGIENVGTDEEIALRGIEAMEDFYKKIGMPTSIYALGVKPTEAQLEQMAEQCARINGGHVGAAKVLYEADFLKIYQMANH